MNIFDSILVKKPKRSLFNLSHEVKLTGNMGYLYPIFCQEVVPGDSFKISSEVLCRFAPLTAPIMHRVNLKINYFFVPNRLIYDDWEEFITGGKDGTSFPVRPYINLTALDIQTLCAPGSLSDYLGFPSIDETFDSSAVPVDGINFNALPFRAYNLIWNEWYMNQNLQNERKIGYGSGLDTETKKSMNIAKRCWEKDYFTSALPFVQRGEDVKIPIDGGQVRINPTNDIDVLVNGVQQGDVVSNIQSDGTTTHSKLTTSSTVPSGNVQLTGKGTINSGTGDILNVTATINDLRVAYRLQRWLEINARAGSRYIEQIMAHFGVKSPDARLQRSEYLGGYTAPVVISEVLQNSESSSTPQGNMAGHAMVVDKSHYVKRFFSEHGWIIGLLSVIPRTAYQDGMPKQFMRSNRYDYYFPAFANLGEQAVDKAEIKFDFNVAGGSLGTFGYQQRFAEMRYIPSSVHGDFKGNLSFWHLGRQFPTGVPALNSAFVTCSPRDDVFNVLDTNSHKLWIEVYNNVRAVRPLPKFAIPSW